MPNGVGSLTLMSYTPGKDLRPKIGTGSLSLAWRKVAPKSYMGWAADALVPTLNLIG